MVKPKDDPFAKHIKGGYLEAGPTLEGLGKYKAEGRVPGNPDVLFMVTGLDMVRMQDGEMHKGVAGLAFIGTVCKKNNIGESEDTATTYSGIHAMAHELCHVDADCKEVPASPIAIESRREPNHSGGPQQKRSLNVSELRAWITRVYRQTRDPKATQLWRGRSSRDGGSCVPVASCPPKCLYENMVFVAHKSCYPDRCHGQEDQDYGALRVRDGPGASVREVIVF
ncbi:hypothetical protein HPB52_000837 [Rhipicephalus sanguineus]|uniref:Metalloprotease n=1 Tax=Rhipicephalus sanguineus TaxID=34632 RepID=A0A9D4SPH0_RHISA|nr:hypothetical protein HPB52_000837 [Rhipicephalus sanguineus]